MRQRLTFLLILALSGALVSDVQGQRKPPRDPGGPNPNPVPPGAAPPVPRDPDPNVPGNPNVPRDPGFPRDPNAPRDPREPRRQFDRDLRDRSIQFQNMADYFEDRDARRIEDPILVQREEIIRQMLKEIDQKLQSLVTETLKDSVQVDDDALKKPVGPKPENADTIGASALARLTGKGPGDLASEPATQPGNPDLKPGIVVKIPLDPDLSQSQLSQLHSLLSDAVEPAEKPKHWLPSNFRFEIGSLPAAGKDEQFFTITLEDASIANIRSGNGDRPGQSLSASFRSPAIRDSSKPGPLTYEPVKPSSLEMELMFDPSSSKNGGNWANAGMIHIPRMTHEVVVDHHAEVTRVGTPDRGPSDDRGLIRIHAQYDMSSTVEHHESSSSEPRLLFSFPGSQMEVNKEEKITIHGGRTEMTRSGKLRGAGLLPSQPPQNDAGDDVLFLDIDWGDGSPLNHGGTYINVHTNDGAVFRNAANFSLGGNLVISHDADARGHLSDSGRQPRQNAAADPIHTFTIDWGDGSPLEGSGNARVGTPGRPVLLTSLYDHAIGNVPKRGMSIDGVVAVGGGANFTMGDGHVSRAEEGKSFVVTSIEHFASESLYDSPIPLHNTIVANNSPSRSVMFNPTQISANKTVPWTKNDSSIDKPFLMPVEDVFSIKGNGATATDSGDGITDSIWMDLGFPISKANSERNGNIALYDRHLPAAGVYEYPGAYASRFDGVDTVPLVNSYSFTSSRQPSSFPGRTGTVGHNETIAIHGNRTETSAYVTHGPHQIGKVQVRGWDPVKKEELVGEAEVLIAHSASNQQMLPYSLPGNGNISGMKSRSSPGGSASQESHNDTRFWRSRNGNMLLFNDGDSAEREFFEAMITSYDWPALDANARQSPVFKGEIIGLEPSFPQSPSGDREGNIGVIWFDTRRDPQENDLSRLRGPGNPFVPQPWSLDVKAEGENASSASTVMPRRLAHRDFPPASSSRNLPAHQLSHVVQNMAGFNGSSNGSANDNSSTWIRTGQLALGGSMLVPSQTKVLVHAPASNSDSLPTTGSRNGNLHLIEFTSGAIPPSTVGVHESITVGAAQSISVGAARTITVGGMRSLSAGLNQGNSGTANGGYLSHIRAGRDAEKGTNAPFEPFPTVDGIRVPEPAADSPPPPVGPQGIPTPYPVITHTGKPVKDGDPDRPIIVGSVPNAEAAQYNFYHAWPSKWYVPEVDSSGSNDHTTAWIRTAQPHTVGSFDRPVITGRLFNGAPKGDAYGQKVHASPFESIQASFGTSLSAQESLSTDSSAIRGYDLSHRLNRGTK